MAKLTKNIVERTPVRDKAFFLFDDSLPGFCVRIAPNGRRHYYQQYMKHKKTKRFPLGMHGVITAEAAREKAIGVLAQINAGADPVAESVERTRQPTVRDLAERYMKEHAAVHCKPATVEGYEFYMRRTILPALGDLKVAEVTRNDIVKFHSSLADTPYNANRSLEIISKMFNLAEMWGLRSDGTNPRRHIRKFEEKKRERYLSKEESKRLGEVLTAAKNNTAENSISAYCIEVLLYTGCRCGEIQTLKWEYIDWENSCLRLPDTKTGARVVYVGQNVLTTLREVENLPQRPRDNPYVFWGGRENDFIRDLQKPWRKYRTAADLPDMRIHDLRHSFASYAISQGITLAMVGKLLGHTQTQTTARYAHLMADPVREAAGKVAQEIAAAMQRA